MFDRRAGLTAVTVLLAFGAVDAGPAAAKQRGAAKAVPRVLADGSLARMSAAQQLAAIAEQTGGGHVAIINGVRYIRFPDGTLVRI